MDNVIIIPGLWIKKSTINSDNKDIIRIIGEDPEKEGNWLTTDSNGSNVKEYSSLPDYVIERDYSLLQRLEYSSKPSKKLKLGDIDKEPVVIEQKIVEEKDEKIPKEDSDKNLDPIYLEEQLQKIKIPETTKVVYKERKLEEQIFDKIKLESTDEVEFRIIIKNVPNINKLKNTAEYLNLDLDILSNLLREHIKENVLESLKSIIKKELNNKNQDKDFDLSNFKEKLYNEESEQDIDENYVDVDDDHKTDEINKGIEEIDEFIKTL